MVVRRIQAGLYRGCLMDGTTFEVVSHRRKWWEVVVKQRRHLPYDTLEQALSAIEACAAAPERGIRL